MDLRVSVNDIIKQSVLTSYLVLALCKTTLLLPSLTNNVFFHTKSCLHQ